MPGVGPSLRPRRPLAAYYGLGCLNETVVDYVHADRAIRQRVDNGGELPLTHSHIGVFVGCNTTAFGKAAANKATATIAGIGLPLSLMMSLRAPKSQGAAEGSDF